MFIQMFAASVFFRHDMKMKIYVLQLTKSMKFHEEHEEHEEHEDHRFWEQLDA